MKKMMIASMIFVITVSILNGCLIYFEPKEVDLPLNQEVQVTVFVKLEHRRCPVSLEETQYDSKGIEIVKKSEWQEVNRNLYQQTLTIKRTNPQALLRVWRECDKKGISEGTLSFTISTGKNSR